MIHEPAVYSDVEVLEIENPKEFDAPPPEVSLHVEALKLDDDVKKIPASNDVEVLEKPVVDNSSPAPENQE